MSKLRLQLPKNSCQNVNKPGVGDDMSVITFEWFLGLVRSEKLAILLSSTMLEKPEWFGKVEFSSTFFKIGLKAKYNLMRLYFENTSTNRLCLTYLLDLLVLGVESNLILSPKTEILDCSGLQT